MMALAVVTLGCPGTDYPKCEKDDQCKKTADGKAVNEFCVFGQCQQCAKDANCAAGEHCNQGRCESQCSDDASCGTGKICEDGACRVADCDASKPCGAGKSCETGRCVSPTGAPGTCVEDLDCKGGMKCQAGTCVSSTISGSDAACEKHTRVQFDFNVFDLRDDARTALDAYAKCMGDHADWKLQIEGHTDERGTTDFNLQLGEKRASSVKDYLARLGVEKSRIRTISYGEEHPLENASNESAWARNRRAELTAQ